MTVAQYLSWMANMRDFHKNRFRYTKRRERGKPLDTEIWGGQQVKKEQVNSKWKLKYWKHTFQLYSKSVNTCLTLLQSFLQPFVIEWCFYVPSCCFLAVQEPKDLFLFLQVNELNFAPARSPLKWPIVSLTPSKSPLHSAWQMSQSTLNVIYEAKSSRSCADILRKNAKSKLTIADHHHGYWSSLFSLLWHAPSMHPRTFSFMGLKSGYQISSLLGVLAAIIRRSKKAGTYLTSLFTQNILCVGQVGHFSIIPFSPRSQTTYLT